MFVRTNSQISFSQKRKVLWKNLNLYLPPVFSYRISPCLLYDDYRNTLYTWKQQREGVAGHLSSNRSLSSRAAAAEQGVTSRPLPSPIPCRVQSSAAGTHPGKLQNQITPFLRRLHVLQGLHQLASGEFVASPRSLFPIPLWQRVSPAYSNIRLSKRDFYLVTALFWVTVPNPFYVLYTVISVFCLLAA